ncbi:uncharacterized protein LOC141718429 [Apium graveolens]|uniref:uncharacterized protein LOC141718429 n=1 Tax=Apium graveolens TaxID=4045 RepID=UPI003D7A1D14
MDWLAEHGAQIDCKKKKVILKTPQGKKVEFKGQKQVKTFLTVIQAKKLLRQGCEGYLAHVIDRSKEMPNIESIPIVSEFLDIFPDELSGFPPDRQIEFSIDLAPGVEPVSKASYHEASEDVVPIDVWEEEDEAEPEIGDGGDGGGIVLHNYSWGARALFIAQEVLPQFGDNIELFSFKTTPRRYIYVRLDKLPNKNGCPEIEVIESYNREYKKRLDKAGKEGELPEDLAIEVSSPGAERLLRVPDDLQRFQDMPMRVSYVDDVDAKFPKKTMIFYLDAIETESGSCMWRLADVKENRDPAAKGRPFSRKQKDWRLKLPYGMVKKVTLYLDC